MQLRWLASAWLCSFALVAQAAFNPPEKGPFSEVDSDTVHSIAAPAGMMGMLVAAFPCGALLLPLDIAEEIRNPQSEFSSRFGYPICIYPGLVGYHLVYFAVGFPIFLGKVVFWDVPRRFWWYGPPPTGKPEEQKPPRKPEKLPAGALLHVRPSVQFATTR